MKKERKRHLVEKPPITTKKTLEPMGYILFTLSVVVATAILHTSFIILGSNIIYVYNNPIFIQYFALILEFFFSFSILYFLFNKRVPTFVKIMLIASYVGFLYLLLFSRNPLPIRSKNLDFNRISPNNSTEEISILINLLGFIPIGYILKKLKVRTILLSIVLIEATIEFSQYYTQLGVFDIGDIIFNSLGILLGYILGQIRMKSNISKNI